MMNTDRVDTEEKSNDSVNIEGKKEAVKDLGVKCSLEGYYPKAKVRDTQGITV